MDNKEIEKLQIEYNFAKEVLKSVENKINKAGLVLKDDVIVEKYGIKVGSIAIIKPFQKESSLITFQNMFKIKSLHHYSFYDLHSCFMEEIKNNCNKSELTLIGRKCRVIDLMSFCSVKSHLIKSFVKEMLNSSGHHDIAFYDIIKENDIVELYISVIDDDMLELIFLSDAITYRCIITRDDVDLTELEYRSIGRWERRLDDLENYFNDAKTRENII